MLVYVIDDDEMFSDCLTASIKKARKSVKIKQFKNAIDAMNDLDEQLPDLIFLDVLLPGPDGFTFINEIASYPDTSKIPIILVTSLELPETDLSIYGIQGILNKEKMKPSEVADYVKRY
jgi:CheY-like chemotaxis protein